MSDRVKQGERIGRRFLESIDTLLKMNCNTLECNDIAEIYFKFFKTLKQFRGNSSGFTGLSEFLVFRTLYHTLGGRFKGPMEKEMKRTWFIRDNLKIGQGIRTPFKTPFMIKDKERKSCEPDISIRCNDKLVGVIQIKITPLSSNVITTETKTLKKLKEENPELKALLLFLDDKSVYPTVRKNLKDFEEKNNWFSFIVLRGNKSKLLRELKNKLSLSSYV